MAIRKNTNPQQMDLQPEMRDLLMRNGMQAHVVSNGSGWKSHSTLTLLATQNYPFWLKYD